MWYTSFTAVLHHVKMVDNTISLFQTIGLSEQKAKETAKNKNLSTKLEEVIKQVKPATFFSEW